MANYCINLEKSENCKFLFRGVVIGTDKKLCNILSGVKPCLTECVCVENCKCEKNNQNG
jgi:hypothetical protein